MDNEKMMFDLPLCLPVLLHPPSLHPSLSVSSGYYHEEGFQEFYHSGSAAV